MALVSYLLDDDTQVSFEVEQLDSWSEVSSGQIVGHIRNAVAPAIEGARAVLDSVKESAPHEIKIKFGIKVTGEAHWIIAKAATEASFEVTLTWTSDRD